MRQLLIHVPHGQGSTVVEIARRHGGEHLAWVEASGGDEPLDLVVAHVANREMEGMLAELEPIPDLHVALLPVGAILLQPPASELASTATEVSALSPIEVYLSGLQSAGSWRGFLSYAIVAGVVVWIGLFTNTIFLLLGAMLLAPFAGPAMNLAIATARGDARLLLQSLLRYLAALTLTIMVSGALSLALRQEVPSVLMVETSHISSVAVLLPLAAGVAGALYLVQSQWSSLVSGASVGVLIAASLAPPAGLIGMAAAIGTWQMVVSGVFLLLLQLLGINLVGTIVFRLYGLSARGLRYDRGKPWIFPVGIVLTLAGLAALLFWQFTAPPILQRSSRAQRATEEIHRLVNASGVADLVEANVRFTDPNIPRQNTLLGVVNVQRRSDTDASAEMIRSQLTGAIQARLRAQSGDVTPLIDVSVLEPPREP